MNCSHSELSDYIEISILLANLHNCYVLMDSQQSSSTVISSLLYTDSVLHCLLGELTGKLPSHDSICISRTNHPLYGF